MISFDEARNIVETAELPDWRPDLGTYMVAYWGMEDASDWAIISGAKECIVGGDSDYALMDWPMKLVNKVTGAITRIGFGDRAGWQRIDAMAPVGVSPLPDVVAPQ